MITVPESFRRSAGDTFGPAGTAWCDRLPAVVAEFADRWALSIDLAAGAEPWYGMCGIVVPVCTASGESAVLKVSWADEETEHEHTALAIWDGNGAARLLAADGDQRVLLMERLDANRRLSSVPIERALPTLGRLLKRLAVPAPDGIETVADRAARWVDELPHRWRAARPPYSERLLHHAVGIARELGPDSAAVLIHADLHYENVLATLPAAAPHRGRWLAIDPKPMAGDLEFGALPAVWNRLDELDGTSTEAALWHRLEGLVEAAELDLERARAWTVARAVETVVWNAEIGLMQEEQRPAWIAETLAAR